LVVCQEIGRSRVSRLLIATGRISGYRSAGMLARLNIER